MYFLCTFQYLRNVMLMGFHQLSGKVKQDVNLLPTFLGQSGISLLSFLLEFSKTLEL